MQILLDESLPRQLARELRGHIVRTVRQQGWTSLKNGELLKRARTNGFDVLVTADQNLEFQQNLAHAEIGVIVLSAPTNRIEDLLPLVSDLGDALDTIQPGQVLRVRSSG